MGRLPRFSLLALAALVVIAAAMAPAAGAQTSAVVRLSDEFRLTRWAHANTRAVIRANPVAGSKGVARLRFFTEDRRPEIYLALRSTKDAANRTWVQVRIPARPNGRTGWVRRADLGPFRRVRTHLLVDRKRRRATLYRDGRRIWRAPVGVGRPGRPTPAGRFYIREKLVPRQKNTIYGALAFGTSAYSRLTDWPGGGVIGIHGTNQPELIPGRPSSGCVRVRNRDIRRLARLMPLGTPVRIR
jgi:hypothetical protein